MRQTISFLVFSCILCYFQAQGYFDIKQPKIWDGLKIKFDINPHHGFYSVPRFMRDSLMDEYVEAKPEASFKYHMTFHCHSDDPRVCLMFDKKGLIVGIQISILKEDTETIPLDLFDYELNANLIKTKFFNTDAYSFRVYFVNPDKLTVSGRNNMDETAEGIWFFLDGKLYQASTMLTDTSGDINDKFHKQGCFPSMGTLFEYGMEKKASCSKLTPISLMYENKKLIGFGMSFFGTGRNQKKDWYEHPTKSAIDFLYPNKPGCLSSIQEVHGITSVRVYLVKLAQFVTCFN